MSEKVLAAARAYRKACRRMTEARSPRDDEEPWWMAQHRMIKATDALRKAADRLLKAASEYEP